MVRRSSQFVALAFVLAVSPAFLRAETPKLNSAADAVSSAVTNAAEKAGGLQAVLAGGDFKTLAEALSKADLTSMLVEGGPYTIFAPTDAAFKKIPEADLKALLADKEQLKKVLQNHVVAGKVMAADAIKMDGQNAKTAAGTEVPIKVIDGKVHFGTATVTKADVPAGKSVVHVIDTVVLPTTAAAHGEDHKAMEKSTTKTTTIEKTEKSVAPAPTKKSM